MNPQALIEYIKKHNQPFLMVVIEGLCGSGKTTLATMIQQACGGMIIHMDDFCLPKNQRRNEIAGHIDFKRFQEEVIIPLQKHQNLFYHRFDCHKQEYVAIQQEFQPLIIIEGSYSMHPCLGIYYDISCFVTLDEKQRIQYLKEREQDHFDSFMNIWEQKERVYHQAYDILSKCDVMIKIQ